MATGAALGKYWTYGKIEDVARIKAGEVTGTIPSSLMLDLISASVQKAAKALNQAEDPMYSTLVTNLALTGSANPYQCDLSAVSPFIDTIKRVTHVTAGGTRTLVNLLPAEAGEGSTALTNIYASSVFYTWEGDALRFWKGSSFTITIATDAVHMSYYRLPIIASITRSSFLDIRDSYAGAIIDDVVSMIRGSDGKP